MRNAFLMGRDLRSKLLRPMAVAVNLWLLQLEGLASKVRDLAAVAELW